MIYQCCHATARVEFLGIEFEDHREEGVPRLIVDHNISWYLKEATCFLLQLPYMGLDDTKAVLDWTWLEGLVGDIYASTTGRPSYPLLTLFRSFSW